MNGRNSSFCLVGKDGPSSRRQSVRQGGRPRLHCPADFTLFPLKLLHGLSGECRSLSFNQRPEGSGADSEIRSLLWRAGENSFSKTTATFTSARCTEAQPHAGTWRKQVTVTRTVGLHAGCVSALQSTGQLGTSSLPTPPQTGASVTDRETEATDRA